VAVVCYGMLERGVRAVLFSTRDEQIQNGHAHRDAVGHLFEHAGLRAVGHIRRDFNAAIHRTGMENDGIRLSAAQALGVELITEDVVICRDGWLMKPLRLNAKHDDDVGVFERFFDTIDAANSRARSNLSKLAWNPHGRSAQSEAAAKLPK